MDITEHRDDKYNTMSVPFFHPSMPECLGPVTSSMHLCYMNYVYWRDSVALWYVFD